MAILIVDLEEALSRPWDHDKYVNRICEKYVNEQIDDTLRLFNLSEKDISRQSALALRRLVGFIDARLNYERLAEWSVPDQERLDRSAQLMLAHIKDLKRGCTKEDVLKAANQLQKKIHPDMNRDVKTERLSQLVNEAKEKIIKTDFS